MHEPPFANSSKCQPRPIRLGQQHLIIRVFRCEKVNKSSAKENLRTMPAHGKVRGLTAREASAKGIPPEDAKPHCTRTLPARKCPHTKIVRARTARKSTDGPVSRQTQLSSQRRSHPCYSDSPRSHRPVLPPSFLRRRISEISIPRSTALHMSYTVRHATLAAVRASISMPVLPVTPVVVVT